MTLQDLTVTGGKGALFGSGAVSGDIDLERVAIVDNEETGLAASLSLVQDSLIARNHGVQNGGVIAQGSVIRNSTIADNTAAPGTRARAVRHVGRDLRLAVRRRGALDDRRQHGRRRRVAADRRQVGVISTHEPQPGPAVVDRRRRRKRDASQLRRPRSRARATT